VREVRGAPRPVGAVSARGVSTKQLGLFLPPGGAVIERPIEREAPAGPYQAAIAEASRGDDDDAWAVRVAVMAGGAASVWLVTVDRLGGQWRTVATLVTGVGWKLARSAARGAALAHARAKRTERLRGVRTCGCGDRFVPKGRGRPAGRCQACQKKARSGVFADKARAARSQAVAEELVSAYERAFVCSLCGMPQGSHELCGGTWVPGRMLILERPKIATRALRRIVAEQPAPTLPGAEAASAVQVEESAGPRANVVQRRKKPAVKAGREVEESTGTRASKARVGA
jgi:hypothetical protein